MRGFRHPSGLLLWVSLVRDACSLPWHQAWVCGPPGVGPALPRGHCSLHGKLRRPQACLCQMLGASPAEPRPLGALLAGCQGGTANLKKGRVEHLGGGSRERAVQAQSPGCRDCGASVVAWGPCGGGIGPRPLLPSALCVCSFPPGHLGPSV